MFTTTKKAFKSAIDKAWPLIEARTSVPILGHFKVNFHDKPFIESTNLDLFAFANFEGSSSQDFSRVLPAKALRNIISKVADGPLVIEATELGILIISGKLKARLHGLPVEDFPSSGDLPSEGVFKFDLPGKVAHKLFTKTAPCMSTEETRYYLNGVFLTCEDRDLVAVATDGHRLAKVKTALPSETQPFPGVIIPRQACKLIESHAKGSEKVGILLTETVGIFSFEGFTLRTKMIDGTFPDYTRVIPKPSERLVTFDRLEALAVAKRLMSFSTERTQSLKLTVTRDSITFSCNSPETGNVSEPIDGALTGKPLEVGMNTKYFITLLDGLDDDEVNLEFDEPGDKIMGDRGTSSPLRLSGQDSDIVLVLMPMRV